MIPKQFFASEVSYKNCNREGETMADTSKSDSTEQQEDEIYTAMIVEEWSGCAVKRNPKVYLSDGVHIEPDLYSEKNKIICEIDAHIGEMKVGQ